MQGVENIIETGLNRDAEKKYRYKIDSQMNFFDAKGLLKPIKYQTIRHWVRQFESDSLTPYFLLDTLIIVTDEKMKASLKSLLEQIQSRIYCQEQNLDDEELWQRYKDHMQHSVFIPANDLDNPACGAPVTLRKLREIAKQQIKGDIQGKMMSPKLCDLLRSQHTNDTSSVYIVDDFIGTGATMRRYLSKLYDVNNCTQKCSHCSLLQMSNCFPDIRFTVLSVVLCKEAEERLRNDFPKFEFLSVFRIDEFYNLLSEKCSLYRDHDYVPQVIREVQHLLDSHQFHDNKYALYLPLLINERFPNNSLELFWKNDNGWIPLLSR